jgi:acyl homoserine lactone synthase
MYRLRYRIFHERLSWEVRVAQGLEYDDFDDESSLYIVGYREETGEVDAAWRNRPTTEPYMLKNTFPQLLDRPAPESAATWEVSRFAVINTPYLDETGAGTFGRLTRELVAHTVVVGVRYGISNFIWVTSLGVERMARKLGYHVERWGRPQMIGKVNCVVNNIPLTAQSISLALRQLGFTHQALEAA